MPDRIDEQVLEFYYQLFDRLFSEPFAAEILDFRRRGEVERQVAATAAAASESMTLFFHNHQLDEADAAACLKGLAAHCKPLTLGKVENGRVPPERLVNQLLAGPPVPARFRKEERAVVYRLALDSLIRNLLLVGPVMSEWRKLGFPRTYEPPTRVIGQLSRPTGQTPRADSGGAPGLTTPDLRFELEYRERLRQRFYQVEAGTVRMTINVAVDIRELFVMPSLRVRRLSLKKRCAEDDAPQTLGEARKPFDEVQPPGGEVGRSSRSRQPVAALNQILDHPRNVLIGLPGAGKSTFLEWLQIRLAAAEPEEALIMGGGQALPLLLRVRELDPDRLPRGAALVERAADSSDLAKLMPEGWIDRLMKEGRVFFMLDGLDEFDQKQRDDALLPWLADLCREYPDCRYLATSRPVGYPPRRLRALEFKESDLVDFSDNQVAEFTRHWCTAVRLAQNETLAVARRKGKKDGARIVAGFKDHPYIRHLARNPLMLSAVCLVNNFEGGELPKNRAILYRLCVEGLLHHWDQRRGIRSAFTLEQKLRTCREVALAMQADDRAEYEAEKVRSIMTGVLNSKARAARLLEHIRRRTGLLLERRAGFFAFAHLTFQEYLAARAVHDGNRCGVDVERLAREHDDARWKEVIALYCGLAIESQGRAMIERLIAQADTPSLGGVLAEAYLSAGPELSDDEGLRRQVIERVALTPRALGGDPQHRPSLDRFPEPEVGPIAARCIGRFKGENDLSAAFDWLIRRPEVALDREDLVSRLGGWRKLHPNQMTELVCIMHGHAPESLVASLAADAEMYAAPGPKLGSKVFYPTQAGVALEALALRAQREGKSCDFALLRVLRSLAGRPRISFFLLLRWLPLAAMPRGSFYLPQDPAHWAELASVVRSILDLPLEEEGHEPVHQRNVDQARDQLRSWAGSIEQEIGQAAIAESRRERRQEEQLRPHKRIIP